MINNNHRSQHIVLVIRHLIGRSGGAERLYCELANMLAGEGFKVSCLYFDEGQGTPFYHVEANVRVANLCRASSVNRLKRLLKPAGRRIAGFAYGLLRPFNRLTWSFVHGPFVRALEDWFDREKPDLVISFLPPANTPCLVAQRGRAVKVIPTNHNLPEEDFSSPLRWDPNPYDRELRLRLLSEAAAVHVLFPRFAEFFPPNIRSKIVAIPNYVSPEIACTPLPSVRDNLVLAVGRLSSSKNYRILADAWSIVAPRYPDWKLAIYGIGPELRLLQARAASLGISETFALLGHRTDLGPEYARAAIFCHPALHEGFGLSVAEALSLQTPVVAFSDCTGVSEYLVDGLNGLLVDRTEGAAALASAIEKLILKPELRAELAAAGPDTVAIFSKSEYKLAWLEIIERVLS